MADELSQLRARVAELEAENNQLRAQVGEQSHSATSLSSESTVVEKNTEDSQSPSLPQGNSSNSDNKNDSIHSMVQNWGDESLIARYSRHLLMPEIGVRGQDALLNSSVLVVGAGGLGSTVLLYLAAAGVGSIGIVDDDVVEVSNLQRQIIHCEASVGVPKVESAAARIASLNSQVKVTTYIRRIGPSNVRQLCSQYDVIVDAVDNAPSRYCLSDMCAQLEKPLVSGSAIQLQGQATVYSATKDAPCYRCLHPAPPPVATMTNCSDGGVLGVVPGLIGCVQALEVVKVIIQRACPESRLDILSKKMLILDASSGRIMAARLRGRQPTCAACGDDRTVDPSHFDYNGFCHMDEACDGPNAIGRTAGDVKEITARDYANTLADGKATSVLIDVRSREQYGIVSLKHAVNIPLSVLQRSANTKPGSDGDTQPDPVQTLLTEREGTDTVYVLCRRGIDSATAIPLLQSRVAAGVSVVNVRGGLVAWQKAVDPQLPLY